MFSETGKNKQQAALIGGATAAGGVGLLALIGLVVFIRQVPHCKTDDEPEQGRGPVRSTR